MSTPPEDNFISSLNTTVHEKLFHDLKDQFETSSHEHFNEVAQHIDPKGEIHTDFQTAETAHFHDDHLDHHEFVSEQHSDPILEHVQHLVSETNLQDLPLILKYLEHLKQKTQHISEHNFESKGHSKEDSDAYRENAKKLHNQLETIHDNIRSDILTDLNISQDTDINNEEFKILLLQKEANKFHQQLEENIAEDKTHNEYMHEHKKKQVSGAMHLIHSHRKHHDKKRDIHNHMHKIIEKNEGKTTFNRAKPENYERFENEEILPLRLQKAIPRISQGFIGVNNWAIIGSCAVATQSENNPEKVDDIDISFAVDDIDSVIDNFNVLDEKGLLFVDEEGTIPGYEYNDINIYGESKIIKGYIDSGEPDPKNPGKNILVEFEAFGEAKDKGIIQIGYIERDITLMEKEGEKIHFIGREALKDQYVINLLYEFDNDSIENYESANIKAKDLMRIEKLNQLGCNILEGIIDTIKRTCKKYPKEGKQLIQTLEKERNYIVMLEKIHQSFHHNIELHTQDKAVKELTIEKEGDLESFAEFFLILKEYKFKLRKEYEDLMEAESVQEIFEIHKNIENDNARFEDVFHKIQQSPEEKFLHFMAISRLSEKFLKSIYLRMSQILIGRFANKERTLEEFKQKDNILRIAEKYSTHSLETFHENVSIPKNKTAANESSMTQTA